MSTDHTAALEGFWDVGVDGWPAGSLQAPQLAGGADIEVLGQGERKGQSLEGLSFYGGTPEEIWEGLNKCNSTVLMLQNLTCMQDMPLKDEAVFLPLLCPVFIRNNPNI